MKSVPFNQGWTYAKGDPTWHYGRGTPPVEIPVTLPHDATIHEKRTPDAASGGSKGYFPNESYYYKKTFDVPAEWADRRVWLQFEGAYRNATVWLNGDFAGQCPNPYAEFYIPCSSLLRYGEPNEVQVVLYADRDSRWYAGAGLYREVKLIVADPLHIDHDGVRLTTLSASETVAAIGTEITIVNDSLHNRDLQVVIDFFDESGDKVCHDFQKLHITTQKTEVIHPRLYIANPRLWSLEHPAVYQVVVKLVEDGQVVDTAEVDTFGIRTLQLDPINGLQINGQTVKLYGGCIHHDNGVIGAATIERAEERRVRRLKAAGYNAIRSAHHPMSRALLRACDRYGMAVMDELTDMWNLSKTPRDYGKSFGFRWQEDVASMVAKDYNHPCVVMYSVGNEIPESGTQAGAAIYRRIGGAIRALDSTRYITAGLNNMVGNMKVMKKLMEERQKNAEGGINAMMASAGSSMSAMSMHPLIIESTNESYETQDICGYNYAADRYLYDSAHFTNWISVGAETFPKDLAYNWKLVSENSNVIGDFVWTSWDYLGEAGIGKDRYRNSETGFSRGDYPWFIAYDADFDITGQQTPQGYYRELVVGHRTEPFIAVQEPAHYADEPILNAWSWPGTAASWNWPGYEGKPVRVEVYAKGDEAELFCNGQSIARLPIPQENTDEQLAYRTVFDTVFTPGVLETVIYTDGHESGRWTLESAEDDVTLCVEVENETLQNNDKDLAFVDIWLRDGQGRVNMGTRRSVSVTVDGPGYLQGLGSGDPVSEENFFDGSYHTWFGHAFAVIRPTGTGTIHVTVESGSEHVVSAITVR